MPTTANEWKVNMEKYLNKIRSKGDKKIALNDSEVMATKLSFRNIKVHSVYAQQEINNLRAWIKNNKGDAELETITKKLDMLDDYLNHYSIQHSIIYRYDTEIGSYKKAAMQNIVFAASSDKLFTNKDIKLMLEYASVTFDDLNPQEIQRLKIVCMKRIKNGSKSIDSMDSLIKALF